MLKNIHSSPENPAARPVEISSGNSARAEDAFTRVDLLVAVFALLLLALTLLPAMARTHIKPQGTQCLYNLRQITLAWTMYADDSNGKMAANHGAFPANPDYNPPSSGYRAKWVGGDMHGGSVGAPYTTVDAINTNLLIDPTFSALGPYVKIPALFKCPADLSTWFGQPRVRSYSMNAAVGCAFNGTAQDPSHSPLGHWLPSQFSGGSWRLYLKPSDIVGGLGPADLLVLVEEHPDSINDAVFAFQMPLNPSGTYWVDFPTKVHGNAGNFSFADGHVETHQWQAPQAIPPLIWVIESAPAFSPSSTPNNPDVRWIAHHTSAPIPGTNPYWP